MRRICYQAPRNWICAQYPPGLQARYGEHLLEDSSAGARAETLVLLCSQQFLRRGEGGEY